MAGLRIHEVAGRAASEGGEYVLGLKDTGTHACYMIYGTLKPYEAGRVIKPGEGHEEIFLLVKGRVKLRGRHDAELSAGQAFHIVGEDACEIENLSATEEAIYVLAGGHSEHGHQ